MKINCLSENLKQQQRRWRLVFWGLTGLFSCCLLCFFSFFPRATWREIIKFTVKDTKIKVVLTPPTFRMVPDVTGEVTSRCVWSKTSVREQTPENNSDINISKKMKTGLKSDRRRRKEGTNMAECWRQCIKLKHFIITPLISGKFIVN